MNEKRKFIRVIDSDINVYIKKYKGDTDFDFHELKNVSTGGILIHFKNKKQIDSHYMLTISGRDGEKNRFVKCMSRVKRVIKDNNGYDIAFEFEWVSREDITFLNSLIEK